MSRYVCLEVKEDSHGSAIADRCVVERDRWVLPHLPAVAARRATPIPHQTVLTAILCVLKTEIAWEDLPASAGRLDRRSLIRSDGCAGQLNAR
ncbi:MAG: hypothetical protein KatS3mg105_1467 [Gemmatales bacterium]|nr:MAG: hypothetical protein KatS3mg105_1467 [Gemmatales bacterium]